MLYPAVLGRAGRGSLQHAPSSWCGRAGCQPPALQGQGVRLFPAPGRAAPVRAPRCYSWLCHGLIGRGRASSLLSCLLMWAACSPRDAVGSGLPQGWESQRIELLLRDENRKREGGRKLGMSTLNPASFCLVVNSSCGGEHCTQWAPAAGCRTGVKPRLLLRVATPV